MYSALQVATLAEGADGDAAVRELRSAAAELPDLRSVLVAPTLAGNPHGGDIVVRLGFASRDAYRAALETEAWRAMAGTLDDRGIVAGVERVTFGAGRHGGSGAHGAIYRAAIFSATIAPTAERSEAFAASLAGMPRSVPTMRRWRVADVDESSGIRTWTHVWEQEFEHADGLTGQYMAHPVHWAVVECWFDVEYPEQLVDTTLVHNYAAIEGPVLTDA